MCQGKKEIKPTCIFYCLLRHQSHPIKVNSFPLIHIFQGGNKTPKDGCSPLEAGQANYADSKRGGSEKKIFANIKHEKINGSNQKEALLISGNEKQTFMKSPFRRPNAELFYLCHFLKSIILLQHGTSIYTQENWVKRVRAVPEVQDTLTEKSDNQILVCFLLSLFSEVLSYIL